MTGNVAENRKRILVVDDNKDAAESLRILLQLVGHDVRTAHDGEEAMAVAAIYHPEVVLLDIGLPKVHGYEVARRLREQRGRDVVLVALTGWGQDEDRRRCQEAGFDRHYVKPVDVTDLQAFLGSIAGGNRV